MVLEKLSFSSDSANLIFFEGRLSFPFSEREGGWDDVHGRRTPQVAIMELAGDV